MYKILKSRTFWTLVIMFVLGGIQAVESAMSPQLFLFVQGILTTAAVYFKASPSQDY